MQQILEFKYTKVLFLVLFIFVLIAFRFIFLKAPDDRLKYVVQKQSLVDSIEVSSVFTTAMQKEIYSTADGVITELYVQNGDMVEKGEVLFHVESTATDEQKAAAKAAYLKSLSAYNDAKQNKVALQAALEKARQTILDAQATADDTGHDIRLGDDNPATGRKYTQEEIDSKDSALTAARYTFESVEQQYLKADQAIGAAYTDYESKKLAYDATQSIDIHAPAAGKIVNLLKSVNDGVTADQTAKPVLVIANLDNPSLIVPVNELYISRVQEGQTARVVFDAFPDKTYEGIVSSIDTIGTDTGVIKYDTKIQLFNIDSQIRPNMTAIVTIETLRKDDVLTVPVSAVAFDGEQAYVMQLKNGSAKEQKIPVELGTQGISHYEVISGLESGDTILATIASRS